MPPAFALSQDQTLKLNPGLLRAQQEPLSSTKQAYVSLTHNLDAPDKRHCSLPRPTAACASLPLSTMSNSVGPRETLPGDANRLQTFGFDRAAMGIRARGPRPGTALLSFSTRLVKRSLLRWAEYYMWPELGRQPRGEYCFSPKQKGLETAKNRAPLYIPYSPNVALPQFPWTGGRSELRRDRPSQILLALIKRLGTARTRAIDKFGDDLSSNCHGFRSRHSGFDARIVKRSDQYLVVKRQFCKICLEIVI
jgi:hypothetical protein